MNVSPVDYVRSLPRAARLDFYRTMPPGTGGAAIYDYRAWARPEQALPRVDDLATIEVVRGGRGAGKTWWACQLFNMCVCTYPERFPHPRIVASTEAAVLGTVVDGPSGLRAWLPPHQRPKFIRSKGHAGTLVYPNGVEVACLSAEKPGSAIGQGSGLTLADDPAAWIDVGGEYKAAEMFRQLRVSNREGASPCLIVPTTARGQTFLRRMLSGDLRGTRVRSLGGTRANTNLSPKFLENTIGDLEGDDWAAEELCDTDRNDTSGALWRRKWIDANRVAVAPDLARVVVSVDPADDGGQRNDATGIVVVGLGYDSRIYVLADYTAQHAADAWPAVAAWAFAHYQADAIVAEVNRSASLVRRCLAIEAPHVPVAGVTATRGQTKSTRAEPLSLLYRNGQVSHVVNGPQVSEPGMVEIVAPTFNPVTGRREGREFVFGRDRRSWPTLEDELCGWVPGGRGMTHHSPGGIDALVWGAWYLRPPDGAPMGSSPIDGLPGRYDGHDARPRGGYRP